VEIRAINPRAPDPVTAQAPVRERIDLSPVATAAAAEAPTLPATPTLFLQVGAFSSRSNAERLRVELERAALGQVQISTFAALEGPVYRVRIGPLASVEEADRMVTALTAYNIDTPRVVID
jgi:rare lipoprotein A